MTIITRAVLNLASVALRCVAAAFLSTCLASAFAQTTARSFDHVKTGFALAGSHATQRCESCHLNGVFKGTPRDCASCHTAGARLARGNIVKPVQHIPTQLACDSCHGTQTFVGAKFNHSGVQIGSCQTCHGSGLATGKSAGHVVTAASCDTCHRTSAWQPAARFNHVGVAAGTCASCHGSTATGKSTAHIPTTVPTSMPSCDSCHRSGFTSWLPARLHSSVSVATQCASCHTGAFPPAVGKPNTPVHAGVTVCETCHKSTTSWAGAKVDHSTFTAVTNCASCHNGGTATGKSAAHIPSGATNCLSCHSTSAWRPSSWNHTQAAVVGQCATCHSGAFPPADGRTATHVPYQGLAGVAITNCDSCHKAGFLAWAPAKVHSSVSIATQCGTCHSGTFAPAVGKPATPVHAGVTVCETCHKSTATWAGAKVDHSTFTAATNCAGCHNGTAATGKATNHIPVGAANCFACHGTATWLPSKWNHTQLTVAAQCSTCHSGAFPPADARPVTHIPYATLTGVAITNCDTCHSGTTVWTGARLHSKVSLSTQCASCHTGNFSPGSRKPNNATHATVTTCEACHKSTASWLSGVTFAHSAANAVGTGTCDTCHNGTAATGKTATHIPVTTGATKCDSCHRSQVNFATAVTMNHAVVTVATCKSCHNGSYVSQGASGALAKPSNHIPEAQLLNGAAMDCKDCHTGTTSWITIRMNHNASLGGGAGWCKSCHATGTAFLGTMQKKALTHQRKTPLQIDCSESGCHRPLGSRGTPYSSW
jgi:Cytochrome c7 and related cytochrome c